MRRPPGAEAEAGKVVPTPYTLHPTPYTLHPTPHTLHPTPYTLHPTLYTLNPTLLAPLPGAERGDGQAAPRHHSRHPLTGASHGFSLSDFYPVGMLGVWCISSEPGKEPGLTGYQVQGYLAHKNPPPPRTLQ